MGEIQMEREITRVCSIKADVVSQAAVCVEWQVVIVAIIDETIEVTKSNLPRC